MKRRKKVFDAKACCALAILITSFWAFCVFWEFGTDPLLALPSWMLIEAAVVLFGIREYGKEQRTVEVVARRGGCSRFAGRRLASRKAEDAQMASGF